MVRSATYLPDTGGGGEYIFPEAILSQSSYTINQGETIIFDGSGSHWDPLWNQPGHIYYQNYLSRVRFTFDFSGGIADQDEFGVMTCERTFPAAGNYTVTLTVTDRHGYSDSSAAIPITVNATAGVVTPVLYGPDQCLGGMAWHWHARDTYDDSGTALDDFYFKWDFGDGTVLDWAQGWDAWHVKHKYTSAGTRTITLYAKNAVGGTVYTATQQCEVQMRACHRLTASNTYQSPGRPPYWVWYRETLASTQRQSSGFFEDWEGQPIGQIGAPIINGWQVPPGLTVSNPAFGARSLDHEGALAHNDVAAKQIGNSGDGWAVEIDTEISMDFERDVNPSTWPVPPGPAPGSYGTRPTTGSHLIHATSIPGNGVPPANLTGGCGSGSPTNPVSMQERTQFLNAEFHRQNAGRLAGANVYRGPGETSSALGCCPTDLRGQWNAPTFDNLCPIYDLTLGPGPWFGGTVGGRGDGEWIRIRHRYELLRVSNGIWKIRLTIKPISKAVASGGPGTHVPYNIPEVSQELEICNSDPTLPRLDFPWTPLDWVRLGNYQADSTDQYASHVRHAWEPTGNGSNMDKLYHVHFRSMVIKPFWFTNATCPFPSQEKRPHGCNGDPAMEPF